MLQGKDKHNDDTLAQDFLDIMVKAYDIWGFGDVFAKKCVEDFLQHYPQTDGNKKHRFVSDTFADLQSLLVQVPPDAKSNGAFAYLSKDEQAAIIEFVQGCFRGIASSAAFRARAMSNTYDHANYNRAPACQP